MSRQNSVLSRSSSFVHSSRSSPSARSVTSSTLSSVKKVAKTAKSAAKSVKSFVKKGAATAIRPFKKARASLPSRASSVGSLGKLLWSIYRAVDEFSIVCLGGNESPDECPSRSASFTEQGNIEDEPEEGETDEQELSAYKLTSDQYFSSNLSQLQGVSKPTGTRLSTGFFKQRLLSNTTRGASTISSSAHPRSAKPRVRRVYAAIRIRRIAPAHLTSRIMPSSVLAVTPLTPLLRTGIPLDVMDQSLLPLLAKANNPSKFLIVLILLRNLGVCRLYFFLLPVANEVIGLILRGGAPKATDHTKLSRTANSTSS